MTFVSYNKQLSLFDEFDNSENDQTEKEEQTKIRIEDERVREENEISFFALAETPGIGFATLHKIFNIYKGNLFQIWNADEKELYETFSKASNQPEQITQYFNTHAENLKKLARRHLVSLKQRNINLIFRDTLTYPKSLYALKSAPTWLFVEGDVSILHDPSIIAVVGTREPTKMGIEAAKRLSILLVTSGCIILSGLAEGVDEVGHRTAVDYGIPTVAVLGHGIDVIFPAKTANLRQQIVNQGGAIVSEYLPKDSYSSEKFVQRNRIQAALAKTVAVIEGKAKSGTAHTVRFAQELHKPIFGVHTSSLSNVPQQELLLDLIKQNYQVFSLINKEERAHLRTFLRLQYPQETRRRGRNPHLFYGILKETQRILEDYDAKEEDIDWLIEQLIQCKEKLRRKKEDDN